MDNICGGPCNLSCHGLHQPVIGLIRQAFISSSQRPLQQPPHLANAALPGGGVSQLLKISPREPRNRLTMARQKGEPCEGRFGGHPRHTKRLQPAGLKMGKCCVVRIGISPRMAKKNRHIFAGCSTPAHASRNFTSFRVMPSPECAVSNSTLGERWLFITLMRKSCRSASFCGSNSSPSSKCRRFPKSGYREK